MRPGAWQCIAAIEVPTHLSVSVSQHKARPPCLFSRSSAHHGATNLQNTQGRARFMTSENVLRARGVEKKSRSRCACSSSSSGNLEPSRTQQNVNNRRECIRNSSSGADFDLFKWLYVSCGAGPSDMKVSTVSLSNAVFRPFIRLCNYST
jgi:hypothetical protein